MWKVKIPFLQYAFGNEMSDELIAKYPNWKEFCEEEVKKVKVESVKIKTKKTKKSKK